MGLGKKDLYRYQKRVVDHIVSNNGSMVWCSIGMGKSIIALTAIEQLLDSYSAKGALVIAPLKVVEAVWSQEAQKWAHTHRLNVSIVRGTPKERTASLRIRSDIYLINYEQLQWLTKALTTMFLDKGRHLPFDIVIFDEISKMKNSTAKRCRAFVKILKYFKYRVGLTGTPATNGVIDLHGQFLMVDGGHRLGPNITSYRNRWFLHDSYRHKWSPRRGATEEIQKTISDITIEMRSEDYLELPPQIDRDWTLDMPKDIKDQYKGFEDSFFLELDEGSVEAFNAGAKSTKCRQLANGAVYTSEDRTTWAAFHDEKLNTVEEIVDETNGSPLLICYQFRHDIERIKERFPGAVLLDRNNVAETVDEWNRGEIKMLIGHPMSMGHGLNLQYGGHNIIWYGVPWSLELYDQAIGRLLRNGQQGASVVNHRIVMNGTVEMAILEALETKGRTQSNLREAVKRYRLRKQNR